MIVTKEFLINHICEEGGWTKSQIEALGLNYPIELEDMNKIIGTKIEDIDAIKFVRCKYEK